MGGFEYVHLLTISKIKSLYSTILKFILTHGKLKLPSIFSGFWFVNNSTSSSFNCLDGGGGETITVQKKFGDHSNIPTENKSFITLANIDENTRNYITKPEFVNRLRIRNTKYNDVDFGVVTLSEYLCCLPEFLYLVTMSSLSEEYYNCEKLPR